MNIIIAHENEWNEVIKELEAEDIKLASYDKPLLEQLGNISGVKILDYGSGPGMLARALQNKNADIRAWDINPSMRGTAASRIGIKRVYQRLTDIPHDFFEIIICNLVLCIVPDEEAVDIARNVHSMLAENGVAYIGFCNPRIFNIAESNLDFREATGHSYEKNHQYSKIKKEGGYTIVESHRPIEWYEDIFKKVGFRVHDTLFTPQYKLHDDIIEDFIIFKLTK